MLPDVACGEGLHRQWWRMPDGWSAARLSTPLSTRLRAHHPRRFAYFLGDALLTHCGPTGGCLDKPLRGENSTHPRCRQPRPSVPLPRRAGFCPGEISVLHQTARPSHARKRTTPFQQALRGVLLDLDSIPHTKQP